MTWYATQGMRWHVDRTFTFQQTGEALAYVAAGHTTGKVSIVMNWN